MRQVCFSSRFPLDHSDGLVSTSLRGQSHLRCAGDLHRVRTKGGGRASPPSHAHIHRLGRAYIPGSTVTSICASGSILSHPHQKGLRSVYPAKPWGSWELSCNWGSLRTHALIAEKTVKVNGMWLVGLFIEAMSSLAGSAAVPQGGEKKHFGGRVVKWLGAWCIKPVCLVSNSSSHDCGVVVYCLFASVSSSIKW